jgi:hypothetical protein
MAATLTGHQAIDRNVRPSGKRWTALCWDGHPVFTFFFRLLGTSRKVSTAAREWSLEYLQMKIFGQYD